MSRNPGQNAAAIDVDHVTKEFRLGQMTTIRQGIGRLIAKAQGKKEPKKAPFKALDNVNFKVQEGEVLGIIGSNGAGKSTMLKMLARISTPTTGRVEVRGKIAPLIEVGAGLISDLTGRENIFLNGVLLGMPYALIRSKFDEIVAFAELEQFIDTPLKRYSSGMAVRLGFSIATSVDADILIVDEVLAVGDLAFQRKCFDRMEDMIKRQGKTVILVSHNTRQIERLCSRVILLDHGHLIADDEPGKVCDLFYERSDEKIRLATAQGKSKQWANTLMTDDFEVLDVKLVDAKGEPTDAVPYKSDIAVRVRFVARRELKSPAFLLGVHTTDFLYLSRHHSDRDVQVERLAAGQYEVTCTIRECPLLPGIYGLLLGVGEGLGVNGLFYAENLVHFQVKSASGLPTAAGDRDGFFAMDATWRTPSPIASSKAVEHSV